MIAADWWAVAAAAVFLVVGIALAWHETRFQREVAALLYEQSPERGE